jgi:acetylornithine deacetylase
MIYSNCYERAAAASPPGPLPPFPSVSGDRTIDLLRDLIRIDSVNPSLVPGAAGESEIAQLLAEEMRAIGMDVEVAEAAPGRPNVTGVLEGRARGRSLLFCGHSDTVGVAGMEAPFVPVERDGRIYGRGAQDMKGGLAAMLGAVRKVAAGGGPKAGRLIASAVVDEEYASAGAEALVRRWDADGAVVAEPTDLVIGIAHKGFSWVEVSTAGRAAHGSRPAEGRDAILRMGRVLHRLEALSRDLEARPRRPLLGTASLHASLIEGGRELSSYPDACVAQIERRTLTREGEDAALREVEAILTELREEDPEFEGSARLLLTRPAYEIPREHPLVRATEEAAFRCGAKPTCAGMTFWTDAAILESAGIPSVVFGPGGGGLHGLEEHVRIADVLAARDVLAELALDYCA